VDHYGESDTKLQTYDPRQLEPLLQNTLVSNTSAVLAQRDTLLNGVVLTDEIVDKLTDYMKALTDNAARDLSKATPKRVPSGLPVDRR
jgi:hypothetical protein